MKNYLLLAMGALTAVLLSSCGNVSTGAYSSYDRPAYKPTNRSAVKVKVSTKHQMAYVMEGNKPLLVMPVSVGTASTPTPKGNFRIYSKQAKRRANTHGFFKSASGIRGGYLSSKRSGETFIGTPMPYWSEFKPAYGFHTGWMKPYPCTHGCIRMHENLAPKFFKLISSGTPVNIATTQPEDATIGRNIPRPPDASPLPDHPMSLKLSDKIFTHHKSPTLQ